MITGITQLQRWRAHF